MVERGRLPIRHERHRCEPSVDRELPNRGKRMALALAVLADQKSNPLLLSDKPHDPIREPAKRSATDCELRKMLRRGQSAA